MRVHLVPIEPIEQRYTEQWYRWWPEGLKESGLAVDVVDGDRLRDDIGTSGGFLDACDTNYYKSSQGMEIARRFDAGEVEDGDVFFFLDGWHPSIVNLGYMRDMTGRDVRILSFLHAGSWDPTDLLATSGMGKWVGGFEGSMLRVSDAVIVQSHHHADMLRGAFPLTFPSADARAAVPSLPGFPSLVADQTPIHVTVLPGRRSEMPDPVPWNHRENVVVFPHRQSKDKRPSVAEEIMGRFNLAYPDLEVAWCFTQSHGFSKEDYYALLAEAKVVLSTARHENFGIAVREAVELGCWPVLPASAVYPELYPPDRLYASDDGRSWEVGAATDMIAEALQFNHAYEYAPPFGRPQADRETVCRDVGYAIQSGELWRTR